MTTTHDDKLTVAQAARRLGMDVAGVLELVYDDKLSAHFDSATGRIMLGSDDVNRLLSRWRRTRPSTEESPRS